MKVRVLLEKTILWKLSFFIWCFVCSRSHKNEDNGEEVSHAFAGGAALGVVHPRRYLRHSYATSATYYRYKPHLYHILVLSFIPSVLLNALYAISNWKTYTLLYVWNTLLLMLRIKWVWIILKNSSKYEEAHAGLWKHTS